MTGNAFAAYLPKLCFIHFQGHLSVHVRFHMSMKVFTLSFPCPRLSKHVSLNVSASNSASTAAFLSASVSASMFSFSLPFTCISCPCLAMQVFFCLCLQFRKLFSPAARRMSWVSALFFGFLFASVGILCLCPTLSCRRPSVSGCFR